jgi:hypothetical protein
MSSQNPRVLIDNKVVDATQVQAIVVKATIAQIDTAEITVASATQAAPPSYRLGGSLEVKLALGDSIFTGRIVGIAPHAGIERWLIRAHGPMRPSQPARATDVRLAQPVKQLSMSISPVVGGKRQWGMAKLTLDPEVDSVRFLPGDTKHVVAGPRSFTGSVRNVERRYGQFGGDRMTLDVEGWMPQSSPR